MLSKRNRRYIISIVYLCSTQPFLTSLSFTWRHFRKSSSTHFFGSRTKATSASRKERRTTSTGTSCTTVRGCPTSSRPTRDNWSTSTSPSPNPMASSAWFHRAPCSSACCESRRLLHVVNCPHYTVHTTWRESYRCRTSFSTRCDMNLAMFPFDNQVCKIYFETCKYINKMMI